MCAPELADRRKRLGRNPEVERFRVGAEPGLRVEGLAADIVLEQVDVVLEPAARTI